MESPLGPVDFLMVIALPGAVALVLMLAARQMKWGGPVSMALALLVVYPWRTVMGGWHVLPPRESLAWLPYVALAGAMGGVLDGFRRWPWFLRALGVLVVSALCGLLTFRSRWSDMRPFPVSICIGVFATIWWAALDLSERDEKSIVAAPWIFWIVTASCAAICGMFAGLRQGQLIGAFSAASGAAIVLSYILRRRVLIRGASMALAIPLAIILSSMYLLLDLNPGELPLLCAAGAAPIVIVIAQLIAARTSRRRLAAGIRIAPVALLMLVVLALSAVKFRKAMQQRDESDPYSLRQTDRSTGLILLAI